MIDFYVIVTENRTTPIVEKVTVTAITKNDEDTFYDAVDENGKWVGFSERAIGTDFFPTFTEAVKKLSELLVLC